MDLGQYSISMGPSWAGHMLLLLFSWNSGMLIKVNCVLLLQVKVDLIELSEKGCSDFDLQAELERSFLSEPSSPGRTKTTKGFKLGKHKHETFITSR